MTTAFQPNAFQSDAFQILGGDTGAGNNQFLSFALDDISVIIQQGLEHTQAINFSLDGISVTVYQNNGEVTRQIGGGIDHQVKRRKATLSDKPNQHLDQIIAKAFKTVFGELTDKKAPKTVQKQANKIVSEYTEEYRPKFDEIDWFAFNQDLEAVQRLFALYQREIADARQIAENKRIFDIIENDNLEFLLMH